jgi:hypothetical protein
MPNRSIPLSVLACGVLAWATMVVPQARAESQPESGQNLPSLAPDPAQPYGPSAPPGYPPSGYPPPAATYPPPTPPPGYPPPMIYPSAGYSQIIAPAPETDATPAPIEPVPLRPFRLRADMGEGFYRPTQVNNYIKSHSNGDTTNSDILLLLEVSGAYYPTDYFGIRPSLAYLVNAEGLVGGLMGGADYGLGAIAPGIWFDFVIDTRGLARYFASPGLKYLQASFADNTGQAPAQWNARGVGYELALGAELSFGVRRQKGISLALVLQRAKLDVSGRSGIPARGALSIDTLDFTAALVRVGFQMGI